MAGVTFWNFYFQLHPGSIRAAQVVEFLDALRRQIRKPLLVVWGQLATHRSRPVRHSIEASRGRIAVEYLPAYAPELNPVEYLWGYWKQHELANVCPPGILAVGGDGADGTEEDEEEEEAPGAVLLEAD